MKISGILSPNRRHRLWLARGSLSAIVFNEGWNQDSEVFIENVGVFFIKVL
jgi:hypothetical protein